LIYPDIQSRIDVQSWVGLTPLTKIWVYMVYTF